jgi:hypothetical protein
MAGRRRRNRRLLFRPYPSPDTGHRSRPATSYLRPPAPASYPASFAVRVIFAPASTFDTGQVFLVSSAIV